MANVDSSSFSGVCDPSEANLVRGWAWNSFRAGEPIELDILCGDTLVRRVWASEYRADLEANGIGDGRHAFSAELPLHLIDGGGKFATVQVCFAETGEVLDNGRVSINLDTVPITFDVLRKMSDDRLRARLWVGLKRAERMTLQQAGELPAVGSPVALYAINGSAILASHRATLTALRQAGYAIVVINSAAEIGEPWLEEVGRLADVVILKKNEGRDFSSWLTGYHLCRARMEAGDHALFLNESLVGPIGDLGAVLRGGVGANVGFWALSDSYEQCYHLQSSLMILSQEVLSGRVFQEFVGSYRYPDNKIEIVRQGEIGLSTCLIGGGVSYAVLCPYHELSSRWYEGYSSHLELVSKLPVSHSDGLGFSEAQHAAIANGFVEHWLRWLRNLAISILSEEPRNPQHVFWDLMITEYGYPFIKRELLSSNPDGVPNLSQMMEIVSEEEWPIIIEDVRKMAGRAPPLGPFKSLQRSAHGTERHKNISSLRGVGHTVS